MVDEIGHPGVRIELKTPDEIGAMRRAGLVVATALDAVRRAAVAGVTTAALDRIAEDLIRAAGAVPSFKGYNGFPSSICTSVNDQVVHGLPSPDLRLGDGDLVSVDCGAYLDGWHGDAAVSFLVGRGSLRNRRLIVAAEAALWSGIRAAARGALRGTGRLTDVSHAVESAVRRSGRFGVVDDFGGHGIGSELHQDPLVPNRGRPGTGPALVPGMVLAIEPMVTVGRPEVVERDDGWTVATVDGSVAAHVEHTVAICDDGVWVLTAADGGRAELGRMVTARQASGAGTTSV